MPALSEAKPPLLQAKHAIEGMAKLWRYGGLSHAEAEELFLVLPPLQLLLQPIGSSTLLDSKTDDNVAQPIAYTLTKPLLTAYQALSHIGEWQLALLGLHPNYRAHWVRIAAARCREAGTMNDATVLLGLIDQLGESSLWVLDVLDNHLSTPTLAVTPLAELEHNLIGHGLHENAAIPALSRILRLCHKLDKISTHNGNTHNMIAPIEPIDQKGEPLKQNWCAGRLLCLPKSLINQYQSNAQHPPASIGNNLRPNSQWLLNEHYQDSNSDYLELFNHQPWLFLLSMLVFVQDTMAAEQRGALLLTLANGQAAFAPIEIGVVVQGLEGDEVSLGSLAQFLIECLSYLDIALYPITPTADELNTALSPMIGDLLNRRIWQFNEGGRDQSGQYSITASFSDACYRLPLAPIYGVKSAHLRHAIKQVIISIKDVKPIII